MVEEQEAGTELLEWGKRKHLLGCIPGRQIHCLETHLEDKLDTEEQVAAVVVVLLLGILDSLVCCRQEVAH